MRRIKAGGTAAITLAAFLTLSAAPPALAQVVCRDDNCCGSGICFDITTPKPTPRPDFPRLFTIGPSCGFTEIDSAPVSGPGLFPGALTRVIAGNPLATTACGGWGMGNVGDDEEFLAINCRATHLNTAKPRLPIVFAFDRPAGSKPVRTAGLWVAGGVDAGKSVTITARNADGNVLVTRTVTLNKDFSPVPQIRAFDIRSLTIGPAPNKPVPCVVGVSRLFSSRP